MVFALGYGVRYSFSVIFTSLLEQFQWSRSATAAMVSFHILAYGITAPIAGTLVDRLGARKTMGLGAVLLALGAATSALGSATLWHYYLSFGVLTGTGLCLIGATSFTRVVSNWFEERRGLAMSIMYFGSGGAFLLYPPVAFLVETVGWRGTFWVEAAAIAVILLPLVTLVVRTRPEDRSVLPDRKQVPVATSTGEDNVAGFPAEDWTMSKAVKSYRFWALCLCTFAIWGVTEQILLPHQVAFAEDVGYSKIYAASVLALFGVFKSAGSLAGTISDRIGREATFSVGTVLGVCGIVALTLIHDAAQPWLLYLYAILFGLGSGIVLPTIAASAADMFQGKRAGTVIGSVWAAFAVGGAIGPWLGGFIFEVSGSYVPAWIVAAAMFVVACGALWVAAPRRRVMKVAGARRQNRKLPANRSEFI